MRSDARGRIPLGDLGDLDGQRFAVTVRDQVLSLSPAAKQPDAARVVQVRGRRLGLPAALLRTARIEVPSSFLVVQHGQSLSVVPAGRVHGPLAGLVTAPDASDVTGILPGPLPGRDCQLAWWQVRCDRDGWLPATGLRDLGNVALAAEPRGNLIRLHLPGPRHPGPSQATLRQGRLVLPAALRRMAGIRAPATLLLTRSQDDVLSVLPAVLLQHHVEDLIRPAGEAADSCAARPNHYKMEK